MRAWRWLFLAPALLAAGCATKTEVIYPSMQLDCVVDVPRAEVEVHMVIDGVRTVLSDDFERYYPEEAKTSGLSGVAVMDCSKRALAEPCRVLSATPPDAGFDKSAARLSRLLRNTESEIRIEFRLLKAAGPYPNPDPCTGRYRDKP
ncbi:hypothetical protein QO010_003002 [Caulobacter ginsengisoli]|uniref:Lipoprotein n=1 Tax=Caulobacter ginsengisoli TaxID=400775 RepID=A0ABU0ITA1_9CAUL|nr:hypothetical protein [Caulobacter ginsengisoli]MDQ0465215.1 hypothetical protein [Caulobacter ginsengisoli]